MEALAGACTPNPPGVSAVSMYELADVSACTRSLNGYDTVGGEMSSSLRLGATKSDVASTPVTRIPPPTALQLRLHEHRVGRRCKRVSGRTRDARPDSEPSHCSTAGGRRRSSGHASGKRYTTDWAIRLTCLAHASCRAGRSGVGCIRTDCRELRTRPTRDGNTLHVVTAQPHEREVTLA